MPARPQSFTGFLYNENVRQTRPILKLERGISLTVSLDNPSMTGPTLPLLASHLNPMFIDYYFYLQF